MLGEHHMLGASILVVDDEPTNVQLLERILARAGYDDVRATTDPVAALSMFEEREPDMVLLDLRMPKLDGFEILRRIRATQAPDVYLPIVVLTADATGEAKRRSLEAGASEFLTKPLDQAEVLLRLSNLLETRRLHLQLREHAEGLEALVVARTGELERSLIELRRVDGQRRQLLSRLVEVQEEERRRIAADIHDDPIQKMTALGLRIQGLGNHLDDEGKEALVALQRTVATTIARLRNLLFELRPPSLDRDGLGTAIVQYLEQVAPDAGFRFRVRNTMGGEPPMDIRVIAYRVAQEALSNVRKHAHAGEVEVVLASRDHGLFVRVTDDGVGLPESSSEPGHLGMTTMRERAELAGGWWRIRGPKDVGTTVEYWLPIEADEAKASA